MRHNVKVGKKGHLYVSYKMSGTAKLTRTKKTDRDTDRETDRGMDRGMDRGTDIDMSTDRDRDRDRETGSGKCHTSKVFFFSIANLIYKKVPIRLSLLLKLVFLKYLF